MYIVIYFNIIIYFNMMNYIIVINFYLSSFIILFKLFYFLF